MSEYNKLQIRAKALSVISELQYMQPAEKCVVKKLIDELKDISDKKTLCEIMINEMIKYEEPFSLLVGTVISEVADNDTIVDIVSIMLQSQKYNDTEKYRAVQLLRGISSELSYESIIENFDNPTEILNSDTAKMLKKALNNPEAQIDFMDFISAISDKDKGLLLNSFSEDFDGDSLANILAPIAYSNFSEDIIYSALGLMGDSKSSFALSPLKHIVETSEDKDLVQIAKKGLAKLKLAGATEEKAHELHLKSLSKSTPDKCYASIPDGRGNQGLIFTRLKNSGNYEFASFVINNREGIIDSFGFYNVAITEISRIVQRFFCGEQEIQVSPGCLKSLLNSAVEKTEKRKAVFPYEFIAWNRRTLDILPLKTTIKEFVEKNIKPQKLSPEEGLEVLADRTFRTWFFTTSDNNIFNELCNTCFTNENVTLEIIEEEMNRVFDKIWTEEEKELWREKIILTSYLLFTNGREEVAQRLLGIIQDDEVFRNIQYSILKRSLHNHIFSLIEFEKELAETTNIFRKNQKSENKYISSEKLSVLDLAIQKKWIENE
ncbi:hypothetical protein IKQ26_09315 [bacterium]|nr:hypothetical protein [bacterium]